MAIAFSIFAWHTFLFVYGNLERIFDYSQWRGGVDIFWILFEPIFWLTVLLTVTTALIRDFLYKAIKRNFSSDLYYQILKTPKDKTIEYEKPTEIPKLKMKKKITIKSKKVQTKSVQQIELEEIDVRKNDE